MNRKRKVFLVIIFCMGVLCGCGSRNNVYLEKIQTETSEVPQTEEKDRWVQHQIESLPL